LERLTPSGPRLGGPDVLETNEWPQLVTYPDPDLLSATLGQRVPDWLVELDAEDPSGFQDRDWKPAVMAPAVHGAYAVQWFGLSAAAVVIWIVLGLRAAQPGPPARQKD